MNQQCRAKQQQAARLRAEAKRLTSPADFAASAKLQRQAVALEAECLKLEEDKVYICTPVPVSDPISCIKFLHMYTMFPSFLHTIASPAGIKADADIRSLSFGNTTPIKSLLQAKAASNAILGRLQGAMVAISVLFVVMWWRLAVAEVEPAFLWPIGRWLRQPHGKHVAGWGPGVGIITAAPWISLCRRSSLVLLKGWERFSSRTRFAKHTNFL